MMAQTEYMEGFSLRVLLPDGTVKEHMHRDIELLYGIEGVSIVKVGDVSYQLEPEQLILINAGSRHSVRRMTGCDMNMVCCVHLSEKMLCEYTGQYRLFFWCNSTSDSTPGNYQELRRILNTLLVDYMIGRKNRYFMRYSQCYALLHHLLTYYLVTKEERDPFRTDRESMDERFEDILHYIEMNYNTQIGLPELSEAFSLSTSYVSRYLKKKMGMTFTDYLYEVRLRYAVEDLVLTQHSVTSIALDHGFPSISVFHERFREKYSCTPTQYREKMAVQQSETHRQNEEETAQIRERLKEHFGIRLREETQVVSSGQISVKGDLHHFREYCPGWRTAVNAGAAASLMYADVRQAIIHAQKELGIRYVRMWSLFDGDLHIIKDGKWGANSFSRINEIIQFLLDHGMKPFIELGEKPYRILKSASLHIQKPENRTNFSDYGQFLNCLKALIRNFTSQFGKHEVESWPFEIWEDMRTEVYTDKVSYLTVFSDCCRIIRKEAPKARIGGAGNHLGWYREHTEQAVEKWCNVGIYPDFLTFTYYPYTAGDQYQEVFSKRKYDENDLTHTLDELHGILERSHFPQMPLVLSDWNMSISSRNFFQDSLWKGCYILKCYLDSIGKADVMIHGQLIDSTTDDVDSQTLINGSGGLLSRDMIEKPAFAAMKMLSQLKPRLVTSGEGYIVTQSENGEMSILLYNFISRNYLYYIKQEYENRPEDHYRYFENLDGKQFELELEGFQEGANYIVRHDVVNREHGSILDEWTALSCIETPSRDDIQYLKAICRPKKYLEHIEAKDGCIRMKCVLKPLEMRLITLEKEGEPD